MPAVLELQLARSPEASHWWPRRWVATVEGVLQHGELPDGA